MAPASGYSCYLNHESDTHGATYLDIYSPMVPWQPMLLNLEVLLNLELSEQIKVKEAFGY